MTALLVARPGARHRLEAPSHAQRIVLRARRVRRSVLARAAAAIVETAGLTTTLVLPALCLAGMALVVIGAGR